MTLKQEVKKYLLATPKARERKNRYRAIANLLIPKYGFPDSKESLVTHLKEAESINRAIRMVQQEEPETRGEDYGNDETKTILEQKKMLELGYEVGYKNDIKHLECIK